MCPLFDGVERKGRRQMSGEFPSEDKENRNGGEKKEICQR